MGIKNRTGCCCGGSTPCLNLVTICQGMYYTPGLYLKNGVVTDANGSWPLNPPTAASTPWTTDSIELATIKWTDGDCVPKTGKAYYRYTVGTSPYQGAYDSIGMGLTVYYAVKQCDGVKLFTDSKTSNTSETQFKSNKDLGCAPTGVDATFTFPDADHLAPPWTTASVSFDVDDASTQECGCRNCDYSGYAHGETYPTGDVKATYSIDDGENVFSGSVVLKNKPSVVPPLPVWAENVGWWPGSLCMDPTISPGRENIVLSCGSLQFLKWCGNPNGSGPHTKIASSKLGEMRYDLIDPTSDRPNQGSVVITDATPFDGVCCSPCVFPRKDLKLTLVRYAKAFVAGKGVVETFTAVAEIDLTYHYEMQTIATEFGVTPPSTVQFARWSSASTTPKPPLSTDLGVIGSKSGVWYFDCLVPDLSYNLWFVVPHSTVMGPTTDRYNLRIGGMASGGTTCDPFHLEYIGDPYTDAFGEYRYYAYVDEAA